MFSLDTNHGQEKSSSKWLAEQIRSLNVAILLLNQASNSENSQERVERASSTTGDKLAEQTNSGSSFDLLGGVVSLRVVSGGHCSMARLIRRIFLQRIRTSATKSTAI